MVTKRSTVEVKSQAADESFESVRALGDLALEYNERLQALALEAMDEAYQEQLNLSAALAQADDPMKFVAAAGSYWQAGLRPALQYYAAVAGLAQHLQAQVYSQLLYSARSTLVSGSA